MLVFTLLDPIKMTVGHLFIAVGRPEQVAKAKTIQLVVLIAGLFILGLPLGITGVALAVNLMLVMGMVILLWQARQYVDFSTLKLFGWPAVALFSGLVLVRLALVLTGQSGPDWYTAGIKLVVFLLVYGGLLSLWERREIGAILSTLKLHLERQ
jgi:O-antigen/teichoic acid export membrane protein